MTVESDNALAAAALTLPHNEEIEQALLGALLVSNDAYDKVSDFLRPEHFYMAANGGIYSGIQTLLMRGQAATPQTLRDYFESDDAFSHVGGAGTYLLDLAQNVVTVIAVADYGRLIFDLHRRRALIDLAQNLCEAAIRPDIDHSVDDQIESAEIKLGELAPGAGSAGAPVLLEVAIEEAAVQVEAAFQSDRHITGRTTGLGALNQMLGGLQPSDLVILAARPSMGKTTLAVNISFSAAAAARADQVQGPVLMFSLEMDQSQLAKRVLASLTGISSDRLRSGSVSERDFVSIADATGSVQGIPLYFDPASALTISGLRTRARRFKRQQGLGLLVVDYIQLMIGEGYYRGNRVLEISEITRGLKALAIELNVPVLALSQVTRSVDSRENKRPLLADLRDSGSIEQDADVVMFLYHEGYYAAPEEKASVGTATECIVAKHRNGPIGTVNLAFDPTLSQFTDPLTASHDKAA